MSASPVLSPAGMWIPILVPAPRAPGVRALLPAYLGLLALTHTPILCPLGDFPCVCFRGILVPSVPRERLALWVPQAPQGNLVLTV